MIEDMANMHHAHMVHTLHDLVGTHSELRPILPGSEQWMLACVPWLYTLSFAAGNGQCCELKRAPSHIFNRYIPP